jgi:hypothetical protein
VDRPAVRPGSFVRVRLDLAMCASGVSSPEGDAYECCVPVEYVVGGVVATSHRPGPLLRYVPFCIITAIHVL